MGVRRDADSTGAVSNADAHRRLRERNAVFAALYFILLIAGSAVVLLHLRLAECGDPSAPDDPCEFMRGAGTPLLISGPLVLIAAGLVAAQWFKRTVLLHVSFLVAAAAIVIFDAVLAAR
jgi:hypothetical protein